MLGTGLFSPGKRFCLLPKVGWSKLCVEPFTFQLHVSPLSFPGRFKTSLISGLISFLCRSDHSACVAPVPWTCAELPVEGLTSFTSWDLEDPGQWMFSSLPLLLCTSAALPNRNWLMIWMKTWTRNSLQQSSAGMLQGEFWFFKRQAALCLTRKYILFLLRIRHCGHGSAIHAACKSGWHRPFGAFDMLLSKHWFLKFVWRSQWQRLLARNAVSYVQRFVTDFKGLQSKYPSI